MDKNDKINGTCIALLLLSFIGVFGALNLAMADRTFSESENRVLKQLPPFSLKAVLSGTFTSDFEAYVSDQFVFRDRWIGLKTDADRIQGKKESNGVYLGKDGYLIQKFVPPIEGDLQEKMAAILAFDEATPDLRKYVMMVPTAATVLQNKLPRFAETGVEAAYLSDIRRSLPQGIHYVDVLPALYGKREQHVFYKTDHHWTTKGAYLAYLELCKHMGLVPNEESGFDIQKITDEFYGSLYSRSGYRHVQPDSIELFLRSDPPKIKVTYADEGETTDSLYAMDNLQKKDKYEVFLNGNHGLVHIATAQTNEKKLLVVKDSYANSFIPFLVEHYSEIFVVDLRYYADDLAALVQEHDIRDMLMLYNANTFREDPSIKNLLE